jgi:hypothetical protein
LAGAGAGVGGLGVVFAVVQHIRKPKTQTNNNDTVDNNNDDDNSKRRVSDNNNSDDNGSNEDNRKTSDESRDINNNEDDEYRRREEDGGEEGRREDNGGEDDYRGRGEQKESENSVVIKIKKPIESTKLELSPEDFKQITEMLRLNKKTFKIL